jgi:hypothetical protein
MLCSQKFAAAHQPCRCYPMTALLLLLLLLLLLQVS